MLQYFVCESVLILCTGPNTDLIIFPIVYQSTFLLLYTKNKCYSKTSNLSGDFIFVFIRRVRLKSEARFFERI